jgi:hypothetical protein
MPDFEHVSVPIKWGNVTIAGGLRGEPCDGVNDIHIHPNEPRARRLTVTAKS